MKQPELIELPAVRRDAEGVELLLALLQGRRWLHASGLRVLMPEWSGRKIRSLAAAAGGRVIAEPARGYCRTDLARPEEVRHCLASLESRRAKYAARAQTIWTVLNRPDASQLEIRTDEAEQAVHEALRTSDTWLTATDLADRCRVLFGVVIGERKIQAIAEVSEGWIIGHPAKGYRHAWRATGDEISAAWRGLMRRCRAIEKRVKETRAAAHGLLGSGDR